MVGYVAALVSLPLTPVRSLHPFGSAYVGAYPLDYGEAFAFSNILYPLYRPPSLRLGYRLRGTRGAYPVPLRPERGRVRCYLVARREYRVLARQT